MIRKFKCKEIKDFNISQGGFCASDNVSCPSGVSWLLSKEESSQVNVILQYKLLAAILSAVCSVIQQS